MGSISRFRQITGVVSVAAAACGAMLLWQSAPVPAHAAPLAIAEPGVILDGVTIVNTRTGALTRGQAILIRGGKIVKIARQHGIKPAATDTLVNATGKFVVPGYNDMHAHPLNASGPEIALPLMVANGITGYRQMAGSSQLLQARREGRMAAYPVQPEALLIPGIVLAGPIMADPKAAAAQVDAQKAQGADFIKVVDLPAESFMAVLDRARALGLPVAGHLPMTVDIREAARRGMKAVEHLGPTGSVLEACSTDEDAMRKALAASPPPPVAIPFDMPAAQLKRLTANPLMLVPDRGYLGVQRILDTYSDAKCRQLARTITQSGMWQVPTMIRLKAMELSDDPGFASDPNLKYVLPDDRAMWAEVAKDFPVKLNPASRATLAQLFTMQLKLVKLFDEEGVPMVTGSDYGGQWLVAGFSLHQEFDLLALAGISPLRILQMTTINSAKFLGREATMGTVEAGKNADLVVLDANPMASAQNLHRINGVVRGGTWYSRGSLDRLMTSLEQH